ncbi:endonuclease/exonuclease/phosphatase [Thiohalocapsa halophila]|uniref:Endonuclease/exonuclease/phosphatase n=1 Tax=Thiohalocapsa halophila TaxID=69359 RepID=A0ABS1CL44_9GAMM|nr:endonuclease/exonuclease/phosphatase family protein [Thiohalocapsa halophila]MBK1632659.1 endonuclease/exonuclease/phosphatase [Thiohalocapsa halophila]
MAAHHIAFWNVENLFDVEDSPRRSDKLQRALGRELAGWNQAQLDAKIAQLAWIIRQLNDGAGPDLLGVCEVENAHVLGLLRDALAPLGRDYRIAHADTADQRGIDVAFLYDGARYAIRDGETFSHFVMRRTATRDLFQVNLRTKPSDRLLVVIGNHWPSRSGGQAESAAYRAIAGETLAYFHERIRQIHGKDVAVLAMGDFNDEPFDPSLSDYALAERQAQKVLNAHTPRLLNLMWPTVGAALGTHYYNNHANVLDQFLVSKGLLTGASGFGARTGSVRVEQFPEMVDAGDYPDPIRFGRGDDANLGGYSDHYPISVVIDEDD